MALVDDALNTIVAITAVIPVTAVYAPLIDVLVAAIEAVLAALFPNQPAPPQLTLRVSPQGNPHVGAYKLSMHWYHTPAGNFKANWNDVAKSHGLRQYAIQ